MTVDRIAKLLQMAEGASNAAEAEAFFTKAQALATSYQISLAEARMHQNRQVREQPVQQLITVGRKRQHHNRHYLRLLVVLARNNGCEIGLYQDNTACLLFGLPSDIAVVETMFAGIAPQLIRLGEEYLATAQWRQAGASRQGARSEFYRGLIDSLRGRLESAVRQATDQADQDSAGTSAELVLRSKEVEVKEYAAQFMGRAAWRGERRQVPYAPGSYQAGSQAAARVSLGGERALAPGSRELPK